MKRTIFHIAVALLFVAATMLTFSACSEKENEIPGGGGNSTNYPESVENTTWGWGYSGGSEVINGYNSILLRFFVFMDKPAIDLQFCRPDWSADNYHGDTYTYSEGNGLLTLMHTSTHEPVTATFSINGTKMTLKINGDTYSLTKR